MLTWESKKIAEQMDEPNGYTTVDHPFISLVDLIIVKTDLALTIDDVMNNVNGNERKR